MIFRIPVPKLTWCRDNNFTCRSQLTLSRQENRNVIALVILVLLVFISQVSRADFVKSCHDGDTCRFSKSLDDSKTQKIRFSGFDAPELKQPLGATARNKLFSILKGKDVTLKCDGMSFGRKTCIAIVDGKDIGFEMVGAGFAWDSPKYSVGKYSGVEAEAKAARRGIWSGKNMKSPHCFRNGKKKSGQPCVANPMYMP